MRTTILSVLVCAAIVSATKCNIAELAAGSSCGCSKAITSCLESATLSSASAVQQCYVKAGCSKAEAAVEAEWFSRDCNADWAGSDREDLRKRQDTATDTPVAPTTAKNTKKTTATTPAATTSAPKPTKAATTSTPTTSTEETITTSDTSTTTSDSTTSTTSDSSTTSTGTTSAASATTTSPLVCSTTKTVSTTMCSVSAGKTITCTPTTTAIASCAPGNICFKTVGNVDSCMRRDNTLSISGLIVAIIFGVGIVASIIAIMFVHFRAKQKQRRDEQVAAMMKSSRVPDRDMESSRVPLPTGRAMQSEDNLPLIAPGGVRSEQQYYGEDGGYQGQTQAPRLHQGLGGLDAGSSPRY